MNELKKKVAVGVIGLGFVGRQAHVPAIVRNPNAELKAVVDIQDTVANEVAAKYKTLAYNDHNTLLDSIDLDAVIVSVPTPYHEPIVVSAIQHGCHVLCEMPVTPSPKQTSMLGALAKKHQVHLLPNLNFRFTPNYAQSKRLLEQNAIGNPVAVSFHESIAAKDLSKQWPMDSWAWNKKQSGGYPDYTLSVWSLDLIRWLINSEITTSRWETHYAPIPSLNNYQGYNTMGLLRFKNGCIAHVHYSCTVSRERGQSSLTIYGDNLNVIRTQDNTSVTIEGDRTQGHWSYTLKGTKVWGHYQTDAHFIDVVQQDIKPTLTLEDAIKAEPIASQINL